MFTHQPSPGQHPLPGQVVGMPQSLSYLAQLDQVICKQKIELLEVLTGFETANRYEILNSMNQRVFFVQEESGFCMRQCCNKDRGFILHCSDNSNMEVMRITREFACCKGCCWCADGSCGWEILVEAPVGNIVGYVRQRKSKWKDHYNLLDANKKKLYSIWGPCCPFQWICCPRDIEFPIRDKKTDKVVGIIAKQWKGVLREVFTDADTFSVTFPLELPVQMKAVFIGAMFLIDFMNFENPNNNQGLLM